jgi:hypothetical protein
VAYFETMTTLSLRGSLTSDLFYQVEESNLNLGSTLYFDLPNLGFAEA